MKRPALLIQMQLPGVHVVVDHEKKTITLLPDIDGKWNVVLGSPLARFNNALGSLAGIWTQGKVDTIDKTQWRA